MLLATYDVVFTTGCLALFETVLHANVVSYSRMADRLRIAELRALWRDVSTVSVLKEQTMGDVQRIFYYHVPSAWTAFLLFFLNFLASIQYLVRRDPETDSVANWRRSNLRYCSWR